MSAQNKALFPVPGYRGGEHGERGTAAFPENTKFGSTTVPGTFPEQGEQERSPFPDPIPGNTGNGEQAPPRKPYRVRARATQWGNADGSTDPIVKLFGGNRGSIAIDYSEIPALITQLEQLQRDHERAGPRTSVTDYVDRLFVKENK